MERKTIVAQDLCEKEISELIKKGFRVVRVERTPEILDFKLALFYVPATSHV